MLEFTKYMCISFFDKFKFNYSAKMDWWWCFIGPNNIISSWRGAKEIKNTALSEWLIHPLSQLLLLFKFPSVQAPFSTITIILFILFVDITIIFIIHIVITRLIFIINWRYLIFTRPLLPNSTSRSGNNSREIRNISWLSMQNF